MTQATFFLVMFYIALLGLGKGISGASPLAAAAAPRPRDCPDKCGDITVPYPFGIGRGCSRPNFNLNCSEGVLLRGNNIQIESITLETAQIVAYLSSTYSCNAQGRRSRSQNMSFNLGSGLFLLSPADNVFTAIGCSLEARLNGRIGSASANRYLTGCITTCTSVDLDDIGQEGAPCSGQGCCQASIAPGLSYVASRWGKDKQNNNPVPDNTCQYAFVAKKGWYNFSQSDLVGKNFANKLVKGTVPLVLDWAIRNGRCPSPQHNGNKDIPYGVCISTHSYCVNSSNGPGYFCNCSEGYVGNPYEGNGCKNINECEPSTWPKSIKYGNLFPCHGGKCRDVDGDYECNCNFGRRGDGKSDKGCEPVLSSAAVVVIGTISAIFISALLLLFVHMEHEKRKLSDRYNMNGGKLLKSIKIEIFKKEELDKITKNYSTIIGKGAFGEVYKGTTREYMQVPVKRSIAINKDRQKDFANEIQIQSQISHKYLVQLLGCCLETEVPMLVYEFVPRGSLYDVLHGKNGNMRRDPISLRARLDIAICSADALAYMHSQASQKILHGDVKSGNILLDDEFMPKVSDFGTSRLMSIEKDHTNWVIGDSSYIDPVYMKTGLLTEKSDVYSFGIVVLELITRKKARYDRNNSLPLNYIKASMEGATGQMYDTEILSSGEDVKCLGEVGLIALQCLEVDVDDRPTMIEVAEKIKRCKSRWLQSHWHGKTKAL
ncbi:wall-associated receptor kinase 2-like [Triticum dicoccoides]|uniref:wall-associated receptor kinase 2-like n=1 Tax=Triticum dicoccoides TaxID=85692 RepID=UPI0018909F05|nr:wall-associated receptor kinase 2-like [Triticum dicoccoides]